MYSGNLLLHCHEIELINDRFRKEETKRPQYPELFFPPRVWAKKDKTYMIIKKQFKHTSMFEIFLTDGDPFSSPILPWWHSFLSFFYIRKLPLQPQKTFNTSFTGYELDHLWLVIWALIGLMVKYLNRLYKWLGPVWNMGIWNLFQNQISRILPTIYTPTSDRFQFALWSTIFFVFNERKAQMFGRNKVYD